MEDEIDRMAVFGFRPDRPSVLAYDLPGNEKPKARAPLRLSFFLQSDKLPEELRDLVRREAFPIVPDLEPEMGPLRAECKSTELALIFDTLSSWPGLLRSSAEALGQGDRLRRKSNDLTFSGSLHSRKDFFNTGEHRVLDQTFNAIATLDHGQSLENDDRLLSHLERQVGFPLLQNGTTRSASHCGFLMVLKSDSHSSGSGR
jgi:hypothetical protein